MKEIANLKKAVLRLSYRDRVYALALLDSGISFPTYLLAKLGR